MATEAGSAPQSLDDRLRQAPWSFDFFQAVRRLEALHGDRPPVGTSRRLKDEYVRFGQEPAMLFAPSTIASYDKEKHLPVPRMRVQFLGLLGPDGPMPLNFTEYVHERLINHHDPTVMQFLDVFHHRMVSLHYRAWASSKPTVSRDRPKRDRFGFYISSLIGIGGAAHRRRDHVPDEAKLYFAGRLGSQPRSAEGLQAIISDYFQVPARLVEFVGQWVSLPHRHRCRLGVSKLSGVVGANTIVGGRVYSVQQRVRVVLGPLNWNQFQRFLPVGRSFKRLADWMRLYTTLSVDWDAQPILKASEIRSTCLGRNDGTGLLGWTTWLSTKPHVSDGDKLLLRPSAA